MSVDGERYCGVGVDWGGMRGTLQMLSPPLYHHKISWLKMAGSSHQLLSPLSAGQLLTFTNK